MRKIASFVIGALVAGSRTPTLSNSAILPCRDTSRMAPGIWPRSESARRVATMRPRCSEDRPTCSGRTLDSVWAATDTGARTTTNSHSTIANSAILLVMTLGPPSGRRSLAERNRLDTQIEARVQLEAVHAPGVRGRLDLMVHEHLRRIVHEDALGLAIELRPFLLVGGEPRLLQQLVVLLVLVQRAVGTVRRPLARVQQRVHHHVGVLVPRHPREREQILLLRAELREVGAPLHRLQRDVHADGLEVRLDDRRHRDGRLHPRPRLRDPQGRREAARIAGLGQQLLRALGVVGIGLDRGKKLLAEAGYPSGFSTTLWVPESGSGMQSPVAMSTVIQSNLKAVGVTVALQTMEWGAYLAKLRTKEQELFALSWMAGNEDPDMVMYPLLHSSQWTPAGPNRALYKNERFDELLHQARLTTDQGKRAVLYREAQRILVDDPPWIFIDHEIQTAAHAKRVQGLKLHPSFDLRVETISLK